MVENGAKNSGSDNGKLEALEKAIVNIEERFGKGAILRLGEASSEIDIEIIPSGSLALDLALGVGGIPRGRITEIFGPEASGKTTLAFHVVAEAQKAGGTALYIDAEHALDPAYAAACGIKMDELLISQPDYGEQALETTEAVLRSGAIDLVVIDSVADLVPKAEIKRDIGEPHIGLQARLMSQGLRKLCGVISANRAAVIFINQIQEKIGILDGSSETTPGGRALKFYATVRIDLRIREAIKQGNGRIGNIVNAKVVKNKVAPPFREAQFEVLFGHGISHEVEILDLGNEIGILNLSGHYYQWEKQISGQKREADRKYLQEHSYVARQIESLIRTKNLPLASQSGEKSENRLQEFAIT